MKIYKNKLARIINFIKNEGKFKFGDIVKIKDIKDDLETENFYAKYIGKIGVVTSISYFKKDYIFWS